MLRLASRSLRRPRVGCATNALLRPAALRAAFVRPLATATDAAKPADASADASAAAAAPVASAAGSTAAAAAAKPADANTAAAAAVKAAAEAKAGAAAAALAAHKRDLAAAVQARAGDFDGSAIGSAWKAAIRDTATAVAAAETADDAQAVADHGVAERMDAFYGEFWAVTNERLSALDDILKGRSAAVVLTEFENPHDLWSRAVAVAAARKQHRDRTQYGATLGATQFPAAPTGADADKLNTGKLSGRTFAERKAELEARAKADAVLLDAAEKAAPELRDKLMHMRREWGTELKPSSARNAPAEVWRATLAKKYPNLSWDEIQRELRDTDADFWSPLDPAPPQWTWRIQPSLYRRPETTEGETRQQELTEKFQSMVEPPWIMHETRSVNVMSRGKQQSFKCLVFAGNNNGFGGYSIGRGESPHKAQERAWKTLMNHMIFLPRLHSRTLFHNVEGRFNAVRARFMCRKPGSGNKAPDFGMIVLNGFGLDDVSLSLWGGSNPYSWMHAIFDGLLQQTSNRARALARGQRLYRELDYNDIPVPAPDEAEWEAQTERVRDAVIDQVYINPIVYPERMATDEEKRNPWAPAHGPLPHKGFAKPYHQVHVKGDRPQWVTPGYHSQRYRSWAGQRDDWQIATLHEAERGTFASVARNKA